MTDPIAHQAQTRRHSRQVERRVHARAGAGTSTPRAALAASAVCALGVFASPAVLAEPAHYEIDPEHLTIAFLVEHIGFAKTLGRFREAEGSYRFDAETGDLSEVTVTVETDSVFTDHEDRDDHLRSDDFLDSGRFEEMTFTASEARRTGENTFEVPGTLTLLGVSRPLVLEATWNRSATYPFGHKEYTMGVSARGTVRRSDFGMDYALNNDLVGDEVEIIVEFEALRH